MIALAQAIAADDHLSWPDAVVLVAIVLGVAWVLGKLIDQ